MQQLLAWQSGDEDGLESQVWSSNPGECKIIIKKETGGLGLGIGLGLGLGVNRVRDRGVNRDRVRAGDEHVISFEKHPPPPEKKN